MLRKSSRNRFVVIAAVAFMALAVASVGTVGETPAFAKVQQPSHAAAPGVAQPMRAISIPFGISSATLLGNAILVRGHDGTPPIVVDNIGAMAVEAGCPPGGHSVDIRVHVRDRNVPATLAKGEATASCSESTWEVSADLRTPGQFEAGNDVWVCAHALIRTDPAAGPGKKGRVVGFRQWCKTVALE